MAATFKRNLLIGFGLSLVLLIVSSVASYTSIQTLLDSANMVKHTNDVLTDLETVMSSLKDAETGQRGYLLAGKPEFLTPYNGARDRALASLERVKKLTEDNETQQIRAKRLRTAVNSRFERLQALIDAKRGGMELTLEDLQEGRKRMDEIRLVIDEMKTSEQVLLASRTARMNRFANTTPTLILVASALSIIITIVFFGRLNADFANRMLLQKALEDKDADISRRINIIQDVAEKISAGDYKTRTPDEGEDGLGNLSYSLNKMASSLEYSFNTLEDKEWLQSGVATLAEKILAEREMQPLGNSLAEYIANYTNCQVAAFYVAENNSFLKLTGAYALSNKEQRQRINFGDGLTGQAATSRRIMFINDVPAENMTISFASGEAVPSHLVAIPLFFENSVKGVLELGSLHGFTANHLAFFETIGSNIGIAINTLNNRLKLQELLEETQSQSEELQAQHSEMENLNMELEMKTEKLQASEEELRVQQEELLQANQELEEKAVALEERNQLIVERNLDIQKQAEELALSTRYKSEFLANMSHELRTPLNSILLLSRLMGENPDSNLSGEQMEYANVIQSSGQGLLTLINEILDLSKIESGKMEMDYSHVSLAGLTAEMKALFQPLANEKGIRFETILDAALPVTIESDVTRLGQIIKNLLSNAIKFTSEGVVKLAMHPVEGHADKFAITVTDSGIGIAKDKQALVFEAFRQADGSTRRKYGGTGLGLSITRELVKLLGGEISLESEPEKGSAFTVVLPVEKTTELEAAVPVQTALPAAKNEYSSTTEEKPARQKFLSTIIPENIPDDRDSITPEDRTIIIIEDDTSFAKSLLEFTRKKGYKGVVAVRGDDGIELVRRYKPVGVLLDIQLPVKDGWEVMDELKSDPKTRHIPVHIISSYEVRSKSLSQGAINFINKPVAPEQMQEVFEKIEYIVNRNPQKVLIMEENKRHAKALAYYLENFNVNTEISNNINAGISALQKEGTNCVIIDMEVPAQQAYDALEAVKKTPGMEQLPIIVFTGRSLSKTEEMRIKQYADSIVVKTANSYQRILDEVSLFLHLMEEHTKPKQSTRKLGALNDVLEGKTVIVADDDVRNIFSLTKALETYKMKVLPAIDGKEALRQLEANKADVVLMDMMMPEMDGYETIRHIKANPKYKALPVIAVTAKAMAGDREKCINAGASDYITKPVDIDQLLSLLRVWLYDSI